MSRILVVGASGTIGSVLVKNLQAQGADVLAATSKAAPGPGQVHLDLSTGAGIEQAFDGVDKAFIMSPPGLSEQQTLLAPLIEKARAKKLSKVVLLSAMGANAVESSPLRQAELHLERSGVPYNIVRPNWFMQNFNSYWIEGILKANAILLPVADARTSFIDARDIAASVAALLQGDALANRDFDLTGSESLTHAEAAGILSEVTGKAIYFENISPAQMLDNLLKAGLPREYSEFLVEILGFLREGYAERVTNAVEEITGRAPIRFEQYARDYRQAWV